MTSFTAGQLEIVMDTISICFFGITALLLIIMTIKYGRISPKQVTAANIGGFNEELVHMIKQSEKRNENNRTSDEQSTGRYKNVEKLANLGLSAGEISKRVSIPKSEIELIVRLKKFGLKSRMKNR
ncbi:MAG: DUF2802 domain-containing protein [Desulfobacteraceae bacterium]|nr:DUF2802 domain-containing protein [Desulfobacteraceae bacterium]